MMNDQQKHQIADGAKTYMTSKGMSQAAFARYSGVNPSYLSNILNGIFDYRIAEDRTAAIADRHFETIARAIGMSLVVSYWKTVETPQFIEMIAALEDAKARGVAKMILGETGCGKTFASDKFREANPLGTHKITVSSLHKIKDVIEDLSEALNIELSWRKTSRVRNIATELQNQRAQGIRPIVMVDETENLTHGGVGVCKTLYDAFVTPGYAGLVLIGTNELEWKLDKLERYHHEGIPQFRRRFKAGTVRLKPIAREHFNTFLEGVQDLELRKLLMGLCNNYGELHDFLEPALRSAAEHNQPLTDIYFRTMYGITTKSA